MQLLRINYRGTRPRAILLLLLSQDEQYIFGLDAQQIKDIERRRILASRSLSKEFIAKHCPDAYRKSFRKLRKDKCEIIATHEIPDTGPN